MNDVLEKLLAETRPFRAGSLIVTLFGDAVRPYGKTIWIGEIIAVCAAFGISDTLVRTSFSRLVETGILLGHKKGRKSYYRLRPERKDEFERASRIIHGPGAMPENAAWTLILLNGPKRRQIQEALTRIGFGYAGAGLCVKPGDALDAARATLDACKPDDTMATMFVAQPVFAAGGGPAEFARNGFDISALGEDYARFHEQFTPLKAALDNASPAPQRKNRLVARLLLVHRFRRMALADPLLPTSMTPSNWPGFAARDLFNELYARLRQS